MSLTRKRKQERIKDGRRDNEFNYGYLACGIQVSLYEMWIWNLN